MSNSPLAGELVALSWTRGAVRRRIERTSDAEGRIELSGLSEGQLKAAFIHPRFGPGRAEQRATLRAGQTCEVKLQRPAQE